MKHMASLIIGALVAAQAVAADPSAEPTDWPQANGPYGNFNPRKYGCKLVEDLNQARLVWVSETRDLGNAKQSILRSTLGPNDKNPPGSWAPVIVADGKVFASSFRPVRQWYEIPVEGNPSGMHGKAPGKFEKTEDGKRYRLNLDAEDITVAIDAETGRTLWLAAEPGGVLLPGGKRLNFQVGAAHHGGPSSPSATTRQGRVFSMGSTGRLFAYDAATGRKLWQTTIPAYEKYEAQRQEILAALKAGKWGTWKSEGNARKWASSLVVARTGSDSAVLVATLFDDIGASGLRGVDIASGKTVWEVPRANSAWATPALWTHRGTQYIVVANVVGELRLIEPGTGKVLWTKTGMEPTWYSLTTSDDMVFVNMPSKQIEREWGNGDKQYFIRMAAYRITLEKAEPAWETPDEKPFVYEAHLDTCAMRRVLARDGRVYVHAHGGGHMFHILDGKTGKVLHTAKDQLHGLMSYLFEDRLVHIPDASHGTHTTWEMWTTDPKDFRRMGGPWTVPSFTTTGYEVFIEIPYVDGRIYLRTLEGGVVCYDLRAGQK